MGKGPRQLNYKKVNQHLPREQKIDSCGIQVFFLALSVGWELRKVIKCVQIYSSWVVDRRYLTHSPDKKIGLFSSLAFSNASSPQGNLENKATSGLRWHQ